jgi:hypothetical protein
LDIVHLGLDACCDMGIEYLLSMLANRSNDLGRRGADRSLLLDVWSVEPVLG